MTIISDYAGRTIDVFAFDGVQTQGDALLEQTLFSAETSGLICTGIQKLAQRFILEILTDKGSMQGKPDVGTDLMIAAKSGAIRSDVDAAQIFAFALSDAVSRLKSIETEDDPDDERIGDISLVQVAFLPQNVAYRVKLQSQAGDERSVILPVSTVL